MTSWGGSALGLEQRLLARTREIGLHAGDTIIVAFSGGPDSLALAAALRHVRAVLHIELLLVHIDHRLRATSAVDAEAAVMLAKTLDLDVDVHRVPALPQDIHPGVGIEEAARRERYRLLREVAAAAAASVVATGHHREDQAETVLQHLLRGSGLHGASAMAEVSHLPLPAQSDISLNDGHLRVRLWRPLLGEPRAEILQYLAQRQLQPITDPSNDDLTLRRNMVRHHILPGIEAAFPGAAASLARFASLAAQEDALLEALAGEALDRLRQQDGALRRPGIQEVPVALQRRIVRRWLVERIRDSGVSLDRVDAVLRWLKREHPAGRVQILGGWSVRRDGESLIVEQTDRGLGGGETTI